LFGKFKKVFELHMARNLLYEKAFVESMHLHFQDILNKVAGKHGGAKPLYHFLPKTSDVYTIYGLDGCPHSEAAIDKVTDRGVKYKAYYVIKDLGMSKRNLQDILLQHTDLSKDHKTWPVVYRNGKFIGGNDRI
jgi:glutaredoxin